MSESVQVYVSVKHMGNITKTVKKCPFILKNKPETLRELISEFVILCIEAYELRNKNSENPASLTDEQFEEMQEMGKFAFGVHYNENNVNKENAVRVAVEAVSDGIVRIFKGTEALTELDSEISVNEGDVFTFVKLAMLSGRMW